MSKILKTEVDYLSLKGNPLRFWVNILKKSSLWFGERVILSFLSLAKGKPVSSIQLMQALFLYAQRAKPKNFYEFSPYLYGPYSDMVYLDLFVLDENWLITLVATDDEDDLLFITPKGEKYKIKDRKVNQLLKEIIDFVLSKPLIELLIWINSRFPEFSRNLGFELKQLMPEKHLVFN